MGTVELTINGQPVIAQVADDLTLLRFLREELHLTGTKEGCSQGDCWACTVLIDGLPVRACQVRASDLAGKTIETIDGLAKDGELHPLQQAFIECGAVQCGFCTPGMIMHAKHFLTRNPNPSSWELRAVMDNHLCRCTGYVSIVDAVRRAAALIRGDMEQQDGNPLRGASYGEAAIRGPVHDKTDDLARVSGRLKYADDICLEGMLWGKILFASLPHAEILSVATAEATAMAGVHAVLTARDVPGPNAVGRYPPHRPVLCGEKVCQPGDMVAAVFADTLKQAEQAVERIQVRYRELPVVNSPQRALEPNAPLVHDAGDLLLHATVRKGNVTRGFAASDAVVEGHYETRLVEHAYLEPEVGVAQPAADGAVEVYYPAQFPLASRDAIARNAGLPLEKVRLIPTPIGGAFGGRADVTLEVLLALGALRTGRPVKIKLSQAESLRISGKLHPYSMDYKIGARKDGKLLALQAKVVADAGAYGGVSAAILKRSTLLAGGPYRWPHVQVDGFAVSTNTPWGTAFRGFGATQVNFALESALDTLARRLGVDPFDLRLKNGLTTGNLTISGERLPQGTAMRATLREARKLVKELPAVESNRRIGIGVAAGFQPIGRGSNLEEMAGAAVEGGEDAEAAARAQAADVGGYTYVAQVAIVQVDERSGEARLRRIISCHDLGKAQDPRQVKAQLEGAAVMGMGYALSEDLVLENGNIGATTLKGCGIPTMRKTPHVFLRVIEGPNHEDIYDTQAASQIAAVPTAAAVANAIYDAVGVRITSLPATKEKVLSGLKERGSSR